MEDNWLVALYWQRSDDAIRQTQARYGAYCRTIAQQITGSEEDARECENDTYLRVWNAIPPAQPENFRAYLGRITRNLAINRALAERADKRGGGQLALALEELEESLPDGNSPEQALDEKLLGELINRFLAELKPQEQGVFLRRYWRLEPIARIAQAYGMSQSKVKSLLYRLRARLRKFLEKEGVLV